MAAWRVQTLLLLLCLTPLVAEIVHDAVQIYAAGMCAHLESPNTNDGTNVLGPSIATSFPYLFLEMSACSH